MSNISILAIAVIMAGNMARAEQPKGARFTQTQKEQIAWAIGILVNSGTFQPNSNKCLKLETNIINDLFNSGLLKRGDSQLMTICIGG